MNRRDHLTRCVDNTIGRAAALIIIGIIWLMPFVLFFYFYGGPIGKALEPTPGRAEPTILLEPALGQPGTEVTVKGIGWPANSMILIYLKSSEEQELPAYATAGAVADGAGSFTTGFIFSAEPRWEGQEQVAVIARMADNGLSAQASFKLVKLGRSMQIIAPVEVAVPTRPWLGFDNKDERSWK